MPKMKTRKSAAKRLKKTGTGKYLYKKAGGRHILAKKTAKRKRRLGKCVVVKDSELKRIKMALPYGLK